MGYMLWGTARALQWACAMLCDGHSAHSSRLIERGVIGPKGRGYVAFALPLLAEYLPTYLEERG